MQWQRPGAAAPGVANNHTRGGTLETHHIIAAAIVLAGLPLVAAQVEAQTTVVSNLGQTSDGVGTFVGTYGVGGETPHMDGYILATGGLQVAYSESTAFTTGGTAADEHRLHSVTIKFLAPDRDPLGDATDPVVSGFRVQIRQNRSDGFPGPQVGADLTGARPVTAGNHTYTASDITLTGGATYHVVVTVAGAVVEEEGDNVVRRWNIAQTEFDAEDAAAGWSIANRGADSNAGVRTFTGAGWEMADTVMQFSISASPIGLELPPISDIELLIGQSIQITLPQASGGERPVTYQLFAGDCSDTTCLASNRISGEIDSLPGLRLAGRMIIGETPIETLLSSIVDPTTTFTWQATDSDSPPDVAKRAFQIAYLLSVPIERDVTQSIASQAAQQSTDAAKNRIVARLGSAFVKGVLVLAQNGLRGALDKVSAAKLPPKTKALLRKRLVGAEASLHLVKMAGNMSAGNLDAATENANDIVKQVISFGASIAAIAAETAIPGKGGKVISKAIETSGDIAGEALTRELNQLGAELGTALYRYIHERGNSGGVGGGGGASTPNIRQQFAGSDLERMAAVFLSQHAKSVADGNFSASQYLNGKGFSFYLDDDGNGGNDNGKNESALAVWGSADYSEFSGDTGAAKWSGDSNGLHVGLDKRFGEVLVGISASHITSETDATGVGIYESELTAVHPYFGWQVGDATLWLTFGGGNGNLKLKRDNNTRAKSATATRDGAAGVSYAAWTRGLSTVSINAEAARSLFTVEHGGQLAAGTSKSNQARLGLEYATSRFLLSGGIISPSVELTALRDSGDGAAGNAGELAGKVLYSRGRWRVEGSARALFGHSGEREQWGVGGLVRREGGADGQGLFFDIEPGYGDAGGDLQAQWDGGWRGEDTARREYIPTLDLRVQYGIADGGGLMTPYAALNLGEVSSRRIGVRWKTGQGLGLDLAGEQRQANNAVMLTGELEF